MKTTVSSRAKIWHGRNGHPDVFGHDKPNRYQFNDQEAEQRFDEAWNPEMETSFLNGTKIPYDNVISDLRTEDAQHASSINSHRKFFHNGVAYIAEYTITNNQSIHVNQLWEINRRCRTIGRIQTNRPNSQPDIHATLTESEFSDTYTHTYPHRGGQIETHPHPYRHCPTCRRPCPVDSDNYFDIGTRQF